MTDPMAQDRALVERTGMGLLNVMLETDELHPVMQDIKDLRDALVRRLTEAEEAQRRIAELEALLDKTAPWSCADCGPHVRIDEDGCCASCGSAAVYSAPPTGETKPTASKPETGGQP